MGSIKEIERFVVEVSNALKEVSDENLDSNIVNKALQMFGVNSERKEMFMMFLNAERARRNMKITC